MNGPPDGDTQDILENVLLPVANESDAVKTARALEPYDPAHVTALHVVEKGGGVPDKTPVEQSEEIAEESYAAVREVFPEASDITVYRRNVVDAIDDAADTADASAIAFHSRGGNRLIQFISGNTTLKLVTEASVPVISLPILSEE